MPNSLARRLRNRARCSGKASILFGSGLLASSIGFAAENTGPEGRWLTQGKSGVVEVYGCGDATLCGRLVWYRIGPNEKDPLVVDRHNPDPALRNRSLCGLVIMWGMRPDGPDTWTDGSLYDPESGNTYSGKLSMHGDSTLSLRGYLGISLLGRTEHWTRFTQALGRCPGD